MIPFSLHPTLAADCHLLGAWKRIRILLHKNAQVRWIILVPEIDATAWHDLPRGLREQLIDAATILGRMLTVEDKCDKINVATIGNVVPQFHMHIVGRWRTDPYWPGVVWGQTEQQTSYPQETVTDLAQRCGRHLIPFLYQR